MADSVGCSATTNGGQVPIVNHTSPVLIDVRAVAALLGCSPRHVYRISDAGKMPAPVRVGALVRWSRSTIDSWIAGGCHAVRAAGAKGGRS